MNSKYSMRDMRANLRQLITVATNRGHYRKAEAIERYLAWIKEGELTCCLTMNCV